MVLRFNVERKKILERHMETLRVARLIIEKIQGGKSFSAACAGEVEGEQGTELESFKRRMGMRNYFKQLKMSAGKSK